MKPSQIEIYNELEKTRKSYLKILEICRTERPFNHKNASALKSEIHCGLRHMERMQGWIAEDQSE